MKKSHYSRIARVLTSAVDVRRWFDYDRTKAFTLYLKEVFGRLFVPKAPGVSESFSDALKEYGINKEALKKKQTGLFRLSILMCVIALGFLGYSIYLANYGTWYAAILSLVVMMIALVLAFRYHFWFFQIKKHKLGCTFQEWFRQGLMGEKEK